MLWAFKKPRFFKVIFLATIHNVQKIQTNQFTRTISLLRHNIFLSLPPSLSLSYLRNNYEQSIAPHPQPPSPVTFTITSFVLSCVQLFVTPWTVACQAPLSMEFSRQEYWSKLPFPTPGDLPHQGSNLHLLCLLHWQVDSSPLHHLGNPIMSFKRLFLKPPSV